MITFLSVGILVAVAALGWMVYRQTGAVLHSIEQIQPPAIPAEALDRYNDEKLWTQLGDCWAELEKMGERVERLTKAVADGIDHVDRNEKRVRGIITGARNRFGAAGYEDPGVEAEADTLPEIDDEVSGEEELLGVPGRLGIDSEHDPWPGVPGISR